LGIDETLPPPMPSENRSLPFGALVAWQAHLRSQTRYDHRVDGGTITDVARFNESSVAAPRSRLAWSGGMASLIDASFPLAESTGWNVDEARRQLRDRVGAGAPFIESKPIDDAHSLDVEVRYWAQVIVRRRRVIRARIEMARRLGVRRGHHPDWDAFRHDVPANVMEFSREADA
jgi:hypothetical protein